MGDKNKRHNLSQNPITGPFPDGDSRNITLAPSNNRYEPSRSGPAEPEFREKSAPDTVMGHLPMSGYLDDGPSGFEDSHEATLSQQAGEDQGDGAPSLAPTELGFGSFGGAINDGVLRGESDRDDVGMAQASTADLETIDPSVKAHGDAKRPLGKN